MKFRFHLTALVSLYLAFHFALCLGLHVHPRYGNLAVAVVALLAAAYAYFGWIRKGRGLRPSGTGEQ